MIKLANDVKFRVKWAGANSPYIDFGEQRFYVSKVELKKIRKEINDFMAFYAERFTKENINYEDDVGVSDDD